MYIGCFYGGCGGDLASGGSETPAVGRFHHLLLDEGLGAGYPSLTQIDDTHVGIVYEGNQSHLVFEKFTLDELLRNEP